MSINGNQAATLVESNVEVGVVVSKTIILYVEDGSQHGQNLRGDP